MSMQVCKIYKLYSVEEERNENGKKLLEKLTFITIEHASAAFIEKHVFEVFIRNEDMFCEYDIGKTYTIEPYVCCGSIAVNIKKVIM